MTCFVSKVINDQLLQDKAREAAFEYAKSRFIPDYGENIEIYNIQILDKRPVNIQIKV